MSNDLVSIADYLALVRRRLRFVLAGTVGSILVMAVATAMLPKVYSASTIIDTGTLGDLRGREIDQFRDVFNQQRAPALMAAAGGAVRKIWLQAGYGRVHIRVDAQDGRTAGEVAARVAREVTTSLGRIPGMEGGRQVFEDGSAPATQVQVQIIALLTGVEEQLERRRARTTELRRNGDNLRAQLKTLASDHDPSQGWQQAVSSFVAIDEEVDRVQTELQQYEEAQRELQSLLGLRVSTAMLPAFERLASLGSEVPDALIAGAGAVKSAARDGASAIRPVRIVSPPEAPAVPSWPNRPVNLLIAFVFGIVGSSFAALLLEQVPKAAAAAKV